MFGKAAELYLFSQNIIQFNFIPSISYSSEGYSSRPQGFSPTLSSHHSINIKKGRVESLNYSYKHLSNIFAALPRFSFCVFHNSHLFGSCVPCHYYRECNWFLSNDFIRCVVCFRCLVIRPIIKIQNNMICRT